jgi:hypothetical protein
MRKQILLLAFVLPMVLGSQPLPPARSYPSLSALVAEELTADRTRPRQSFSFDMDAATRVMASVTGRDRSVLAREFSAEVGRLGARAQRSISAPDSGGAAGLILLRYNRRSSSRGVLEFRVLTRRVIPGSDESMYCFIAVERTNNARWVVDTIGGSSSRGVMCRAK